jgi:hypothetical protein
MIKFGLSGMLRILIRFEIIFGFEQSVDCVFIHIQSYNNRLLGVESPKVESVGIHDRFMGSFSSL